MNLERRRTYWFLTVFRWDTGQTEARWLDDGKLAIKMAKHAYAPHYPVEVQEVRVAYRNKARLDEMATDRKREEERKKEDWL